INNPGRTAWLPSPVGGPTTHRVLAPTPTERVIEIKDQGSGIPEEKLAEILTPFFTTKEKGSGLGLALTGKIIEQHGGQMTIDSTVGEGTTVRFVLPFDPNIEQAARAQAAIPEGWLG
ncbi:MAG: ATP-binding protein, partial [Myxococcota bacterium]|nr:ATP-binding protein [Myxococcota bacterium]